MGHVEPGGAAGGPPASAADPLWPVWRRLTPEFSIWRLLVGAMISGTGWGFYGVDLISNLRRSPMAERAFNLLAAVSDRDLERLADLARVNSQRHDSMWRMSVMFYVSVPATGALALLQIAPEAVAAAFTEGSVVLWVAIGAILSSMLYYFGAHWRARQILAVLEMVRLERNLQAG